MVAVATVEPPREIVVRRVAGVLSGGAAGSAIAAKLTEVVAAVAAVVVVAAAAYTERPADDRDVVGPADSTAAGATHSGLRHSSLSVQSTAFPPSPVEMPEALPPDYHQRNHRWVRL